MFNNKLNIKIILFCFIIINNSTGQNLFNNNPTKIIIEEANNFNELPVNIFDDKSFTIDYGQYYYFNNNLSNFENINGLYLPKGSGNISSLKLSFKFKNILFTVGKKLINYKIQTLDLNKKAKIFSVLNDVTINNYYQNNFIDTGILFRNQQFYFGYGNWNYWWGPGIHNSLVLTNNSEGFNHYVIGSNDYITIIDNLSYNFKYIVSNKMKNMYENNFYLSAYFLQLKYKNIELGKSKNILSGGYDNIIWSLNDASKVLISNDKIRFWDEITDYYIKLKLLKSKLIIFYEAAYPNRNFNSLNNEHYSDHAKGTNIGLRKYGAFGLNELFFGFEYTRIIQGIYYNIIPTPNFYDNIRYNYSSYNQRRWASHSGSDSDDLLFFIGYKKNKTTLIYGLNYERHGVTYKFPPEVKLESRISFSYNFKYLYVNINYENEYYENYAFVDNNRNIWLETYENASKQRTNTLLFTIEYKLLR